MIPIVVCPLGTVSKELEKGLVANRRKNRDYLNDSIVEIDPNTQKCSVYLKRLAVTQTLVKGYKLTLVRKTCKEYNKQRMTNFLRTFYETVAM